MKASTQLQNQIETICLEHIKALRLPDDFIQVIRDVYLPLSEKLLQHKTEQPFFVSINGAQGTGKSTLTSFLQILLQARLNAPVAAFSIDDFYATHQQRQKLGHDIHPLLATRGVPGTHDLDLLENVLDNLLSQKPCKVPRFDKAIDDRCEKHEWSKYDQPVKVILFEGWCNHSPSQTAAELEQPINELEATEDQQGTWRNYANDKLNEYHKRVFSFADTCIMLKSPDFEHVYQWRALQEEKLRQATSTQQSHRLMDQATLKRFIQHYERITRHTLKHLPDSADFVLPVNPNHSITGIIERHAKG